MGMDVSFYSERDIVCPHCQTVVEKAIVRSAYSGGRTWRECLRKIGYYTEDGKWYGKDMKLSEEQVKQVYDFIKESDYLVSGEDVACLLAEALLEKYTVWINADW